MSHIDFDLKSQMELNLPESIDNRSDKNFTDMQ